MSRNKWLNAALPAVLLHGSIGSVYAFSLLVKPISEHINRSTSQVQFAFSLAIFFLGMSAAFGGNIVEKNIHKSSLISCSCFFCGLIITSLAMSFKSLALLYIGYGCVMGIGLGIGYLTPVKTLMLWFKDNKGLATGISVCAFGFASTIASPIITFLLNNYKLSTVFLILSFIYYFPMLIAHNLLYKPEGWIESQVQSGFKTKRLLKDYKFRSIWFVIFINITCGLAVISIASPMLSEQGMAKDNIAAVISIMGIFNGCGRLVFSAFSDKLNNRAYIYNAILIISIIMCVLALAFTQLSFISLILISACYGAGFSCLPSMLSDIYDMKHISKIHGLSLTAWAMAGLCGNQMSEIIHNNTGNYINVFKITLILYVIALAINMIVIMAIDYIRKKRGVYSE